MGWRPSNPCRNGVLRLELSEYQAALEVFAEQGFAMLCLRCGDDECTPPTRAVSTFDLSGALHHVTIDRLRIPCHQRLNVIPCIVVIRTGIEIACDGYVAFAQHLH